MTNINGLSFTTSLARHAAVRDAAPKAVEVRQRIGRLNTGQLMDRLFNELWAASPLHAAKLVAEFLREVRRVEPGVTLVEVLDELPLRGLVTRNGKSARDLLTRTVAPMV